MKKILLITYSQSGQLETIVSNIVKNFGKEIMIHHEHLKPVPDYPFPWKGTAFWDAMPECVELVPSQLKPFHFNSHENFDLVILCYPVWFLSPPVPITTFLKSEEGRQVLKNRPVITVIGARNMWVMAQEEIKKLIVDAGARLKANIALFDRQNNLVSVITIIYWMTSGKKDHLFGIFPKPGISDDDIRSAERFGAPIEKAILSSNYDHLHDQLLDLKSVELNSSIVSIEQKGKRIFRIWARIIRKKGGPGNIQRVPLLKIFKWYLLFAIFAVSPIVTLFYYITYPVFYKQINKKIDYFKGTSLKMK